MKTIKDFLKSITSNKKDKDFDPKAEQEYTKRVKGNPEYQKLLKKYKAGDKKALDKMAAIVRKEMDKDFPYESVEEDNEEVISEQELNETNDDTYRWEDINTALMKTGFGAKVIIRVLFNLKGKKVKK